MKVGFVQFEPIFGQKKENVEKSIALIESADANLLVLPELCNSGYLFISKQEVEELAEEIPHGPTLRAWMDVAKRKKINLVAGMAERDKGKLFNSAVLVRPTGAVEVYRKAHLFSREKLWFGQGDTPFSTYDVNGIKIGMMVCFDWIFPEVMRILSLKGAQIICHPANLILPYCQKAMITRCIENRVFAITSNRTGSESRGEWVLTYTGASQIVDPKGKVLAQADDVGETVQVIEIYPQLADDKYITEFNHIFEDRRIDLFGRLVERCHNPFRIPEKG